MGGMHGFRKKTGGRLRGTPNKRTQAVSDLLEVIGCDPINGMATIAMNPANSPELRGRMYSELAQYLFPKRRAAETRLGDQQRIIFNLRTFSDT